MTDNRKLAEYKEHQACEVPLTELLRDIPKDFRVVLPCQWSDDGRETGYRFIPVGYLMHRAANELDAAAEDRAWEKAMANITGLERNAVLEEAAKECLKRVGDTLTNDECCYGMANAIRALKNNAAPDCNATLEAWTFIDAVSAMGFPPQWAYVAEEANRIRALKNKAN